jgi:hypothetical protein
MYGQSVLQISGVVDRIVEALQRTETMPATIADALDRGARPLGEWRTWIRSAVSGRGGFRDVVLPAEAIERVLEAAGTKPEQRVGAALALRELRPNAHPEDARLRIRVAAEASADPHMRALLEAVAEDEIDDAKLEALLRAETG